MDVTKNSWLVRRASLLLAEGASGQLDPPLTFAAVAPAIAESRVAALVAASWRRIAAMVDDTTIGVLIQRATNLIAFTDAVRRVAIGAGIVLVATLSHLFMLLAVEQYHFPRRTAVVLPTVIAVVALIVYLRPAAIANAARDRRHR